MLYCVFWSSSKKAAKYLPNNCYFPPNKKILQKEVYKQKENLHGKSSFQLFLRPLNTC